MVIMPQQLSKPVSWRSKLLRLNWLDYTLLALIGLLASWLYYRAAVGINYTWHWQEAIALIFTPSRDGGMSYFLQGLAATVRLSLWGILLAMLLGLLLGLARFSRHALLRVPATAYVLLIRNIPPLVFVFIFYFFVSNQLIPLLGLQSLLREHHGELASWQAVLFGPTNLWENLVSGVLCVSMLSAAYIAEIVRSGLESIPKGQWEAAKSLGLSPVTRFVHVIFPQVLTLISPTLAGQTISLIKDTSIVSLISIQEMTFVGTEMANSSGYIFEIWLMVGGAYLLLCLFLSRIFRLIEKRQSKYYSLDKI